MSETDVTPAWHELYESARDRAVRLTNGMTDEAARWRPGPGRWSVAECVDHLAVSMGTYFDRMDAAIERGRRKGRPGAAPYGRGTFLGRFILNAMRGGPAKMKVKAPKVFRPAPEPPAIADAVRAFDAATARMLALLAAADGLPLGRLKFGTPVSRLVRVSLAQAFEIHALHNHRHLDQADRVTAEAGFPG